MAQTVRIALDDAWARARPSSGSRRIHGPDTARAPPICRWLLEQSAHTHVLDRAARVRASPLRTARIADRGVTGGGAPSSDHGAMMRPGAPFAPATVWHELQSPAVIVPTMARVFVPSVTFTE